MFNNDKRFSINDFTAFAFFCTFISLILTVMHIFIMHFYSKSYREYRCNNAVKELRVSIESRIHKQLLRKIQTELLPEIGIQSLSSENELMTVTANIRYEDDSQFNLISKQSGNYASYRYKYKTMYEFSAKEYCKQYASKQGEDSDIVYVNQIPLSQWAFYNSSIDDLKFRGDIDNYISGRVFSRSPIHLNYHNKDNISSGVRYLGDMPKNKLTFLSNYSPDGMYTGFEMLSGGKIFLDIDKLHNSLVYMKNFLEFKPYKTIFDIQPQRIISSILSNEDAKPYNNYIKIDVPQVEFDNQYYNINYFKWFPELLNKFKTQDAITSLKRNHINIISFNLQGDGIEMLHIDTAGKLLEKKFATVSWIKEEKDSYEISLKYFIKWYRGLYNVRIPIIEQKVFKTKALMCLFNNPNKKNYILKDAKEIPLRLFMVFNTSLTLNGEINNNGEPFYILADSYSYNMDSSSSTLLQAVLIRRHPILTAQEFFKYKQTQDITIKGSMILLSQEDKNYSNELHKPEQINLKDFHLIWDRNLYENKSWIDFVPSRYYLSE